MKKGKLIMADLRTQDSTQSFETTDVLSLWKDLERISKEAILKVDGVLSTKESRWERALDFLNDQIESQEANNEEINTEGVQAYIDQEKDEVTIEADILLEYGKSGEKVFQEIQKSVKDAVRSKKSKNVVEVNVNIYDILTREEFNQLQKEKTQDHPASLENKPADESLNTTPIEEFTPDTPLADEGVHYEGAANQRKYKNKKHRRK